MNNIQNIQSKANQVPSKILFILYGLMLLFTIFEINPYILIVFCVACYVTGIVRGLDKTAVLLFLFSITYVLNSFLFGKTTSFIYEMGYLLAPLSFYSFGRSLLNKFKTEDGIFTFWLVSIILYVVLLFFLVAKDISKVGFINPERVISDTQYLSLYSATGFGVVTSFALAGLPFLFIRKKYKRTEAFLFTIVGILALIVNIHLVSRSNIFISGAILIIVLIYMFVGRMRGFFVFVSLVGIFYLIVLSSNTTEVLDAYAARDIEGEAITTFGSRLDRWGDALNNIFKYPLGWINENTTYANAHNMWLDFARWAGVVPFILSLFFTIGNFKYIIKLFNNQKDDMVVVLLLGLNVSFFLSCFVEPILIGVPSFFYLYCMLWGFQKEYYLRSTKYQR